MPNQTRTAINIGDVITADAIPTLPIGTVIRDRDGDTYNRTSGSAWTRTTSAGRTAARDWLDRDVQYLFKEDGYAPVTLLSLPPTDQYQQARLALRDRYGTEPDIDSVHAVERIMQDHHLDATAAVTASALSRAELASPDVAAQIASGRDQTLADLFVVIVAHGADANSRVVVSADTTPGLARLRAHAALDNLLDQHGISR